MDRSPIQRTLWYDPTKTSLINLTTHTFNNGYYQKTVSNFDIKFNVQQPEMSHSKNCTAAFVDYLSHNPWITISCDTLYNISYVCQSRKVIERRSKKALIVSLVSYKMCASEWFMLDGSDQCFLLIPETRELSYYDAKSMCRAENASIFTVEVSNMYSDKGYTENSFLKIIINALGTVVKNVPREKLYRMLFGAPLSRHSPHSHLADIIIKLANIYGSTFFVDLKGKCSVLKLSSLSTAVSSEPETSTLRGWGVKCRYCTEPVEVTDVICEKPSELYNSQCQPNHFTCKDKTCILSIYECDFVYDCFDNSDEDNCTDAKTNNTSNHFVNIPCILGDSYTVKEMCQIPIHAVCDGIYFNAIFRQEEIVCYQHTLNNIHLASLIPDNHRIRPIDDRSILDNPIDAAYFKEMARCSNNLDTINHHGNYTPSRYKVKGELSRVSTLCKVSYLSKQPFPDMPQLVCQNIACPEMFKCNKYYCIYMSSVCDGQNDCAEGDDEISCPITSCPGLLKCRGEMRCVSKKELCDNHIDCVYSMDDEADCLTCPRNCDCTGYSVSCVLNNSLEVILTNAIDHFKGIILKGIQRELSVHQLRSHGLVYLNVSFCNIEKIFLIENESMVNTYIIIADFQSNYIITIHFLKANIFKNLVSLELSSNRLYVINFGIHLFLTKLVVLILKGNPLREIAISSFRLMSNLQWINIQRITVYSDLKIKLPSTLREQITIIVSDSIICCMVKSIRCLSHSGHIMVCFGLLHTLVSTIIFYFTCIIATLSAVFILIKRIRDLSLVKKHVNSKKQYYLITWINHSISLLLISLYLVSLAIADISQVNLFYWTQSVTCIILNILLFTSLESLVVFKGGLVLILALQIIYPFKHQCLWLRRTVPVLSVIWLAILSTYFPTFTEETKFGYICDSICSIGMCGVTDPPHILMKMTCCIDFFFATMSIFPIMKIFMVMDKSKETLNMGQTNKTKSVNKSLIIFKVASPILLELPFRLCLLILLVISFSSVNYASYCRYLFLFALPVNLVCSSVFFLGHK